MAGKYIYPLSKRWLKPCVGSKAANINFLVRHGIDVPNSWVILWTAREDNLRDSNKTQLALRREMDTMIDPEKFYAVRSSASVEDSGDFSCAGLFKSYLQVRGIDHIMSSIASVWASLESPEFVAYWTEVMNLKIVPRMAVIVQEMVQPHFSGVVFTKNPVTGFSETIIEAGQGTGETQVECRQNPERWVSKWGNWSQKPQNGLLNEDLAREIVVKSNEISQSYRQPADLEWAWDGCKLYFLQIRPITRLDIPVYSNRIAREMLPGFIKPLVWSVNTRLINPVWANILERLTGEHSWNPEEFTGHYYYRAYFNMNIFAKAFERLGMPAEALELLFGLEQDGPEKPKMKPGHGIILRLPRMIVFALSFSGINYRLLHILKTKKPAYEKLAARIQEEQASAEMLKLALEVFDETKVVGYYNIMIPLLGMMYYRLLSGMLKKQGYDLRLIELNGAREAAARYNPQHTLQVLHDRYFSDCDIGQGEAVLSSEENEQLKNDINKFLQEFGHFSDSGNDCSSIPWKELPDLVLRMIIQQKGVRNQQDYMSFKDLDLSWTKRMMIGFIFRRASQFAVSREEISSLYTYGYGQFRTCFVRLGDYLVEQGMLDDREDVYYLYWPELLEILDKHETMPQQALVSSRKHAIESYQEAVLPELILGSEQPPVMKTVQYALKGIPTSLGTYSGPARIINGIDDFEKMQDGDVMIIPFSDVGWIPLFAKAGAVVSESGGILSHSSIVAREYGIPAVVSVLGICHLADGTMITVNGYTGDIVLCPEGRDT